MGWRTTELSPREKDVLWLYGYEGEPMKRVASELDIALETAKSYMKRIREKLRARDEPIPADSRVDLYRAALEECKERPIAQAAQRELLHYLLETYAPVTAVQPLAAVA